MIYGSCEYCNGEVLEKLVRVDFRTGEKLVVIEDVPVGVCKKCGERYYDAKVLKSLEVIAKQRKKSKLISVPVKQYDAAASV